MADTTRTARAPATPYAVSWCQRPRFAVSGALILFLVLAQVMGGIAFVPVMRRVIEPIGRQPKAV